MTARLDESFQQIQRLTLHALHELKTPLTVMRLHLETALGEAKTQSSEQRRWMLTQIDELQRLTRIVDGLTLLTKADAGLVKLECAPLQLKKASRRNCSPTFSSVSCGAKPR